MRKAKSKILAVTALLLAATLVAGTVWAKATKAPIVSTHDTITTDWGKVWVDDEGILHIRGMKTMLIFPGTGSTGDLVGTGTGIINLNLTWTSEEPSGTGEVYGYWILNVSWRGLSGTFEGHTSTEVTEHIGHGTAVLQGTDGDFVGMKMLLNTYVDGTTWTGGFEGIILDPHGRIAD